MKSNLFNLVILVSLAVSPAAFASQGGTPDAKESGSVEIPLDVYRELLASSQPDGPGPRNHALGQATVDVRVEPKEGRATAQVEVSLRLSVLVDEWVLVPVLPVGTPIVSVTIDGEPVQLMATPAGLAWAVNKAGTYQMSLRYPVDAARSEAGYVASIPLPAAAATAFRAQIPGSGLDAALLPGAGLSVTLERGHTIVSATLPATGGVALSWRVKEGAAQTISRAVYRGELAGDAIIWKAELDVELTRDEATRLPLLPSHVTLNELLVDGQKAAIAVTDGYFAAALEGRGLHQVQMTFQVGVEEHEGRPGVALSIPAIPISRFEVRLPGSKSVTVAPVTNVTHENDEATTLATFHVPMRDSIAFSWGEAIPEVVETEVRAHAQVFHAVRAQEGVLYVEAAVQIDVSRGELSVIELQLPADVQVERVEAVGGELADWRITRGASGEQQQLSAFLDGALAGSLQLRVHYDRPIDGTRLEIPLLSALRVDRQRGMVALLATREVALDPVASESLTSVGENQLPAFFRQGITDTVAHTFKYAQATPRLTAALAKPERIVGKFDVEVDTLISITDVTVQGAAGVRVLVKSGTIDMLRLTLPDDVNLLTLTAPSLRTYKVVTDGQDRYVDVEFTQDMEGHFRIEVAYERIVADPEAEIAVPTLTVVGAEVEQGRIAVEALAAVEVQVARADQLSSVDPADLPRQLILKTTNPILLAYKYVHADAPVALALRMTRHREVAVQGAAIDRADYRTLFTSDGLAVTTARFEVRNRRQQFLRVRLPEGSTIWSASVDGKPEKPAISEKDGPDGDGAEPEILLRILNSAEAFPVELVYATPVSKMGMFGAVRATLPRPGMVVTHSRWSVFLPESHRYGTPDSSLTMVVAAQHLDRERLAKELAFDALRGVPVVGPLQIAVPDAGVRFTFEKLYANQSDEEAFIAIPYRSPAGARMGNALSLLGTLLVWLGLALSMRRVIATRPVWGGVTAMVGVVLLGVALGRLGGEPTGALLLAGALTLASAAVLWRERRQGVVDPFVAQP